MRISLRNQFSLVGSWRSGEASTALIESRPGVGTESLRSVQDRRQELSRFTEAYEEFVELICDSAQLGLDSRRETRYGVAREQVQARYTPIRPFVAAFLPPDDRDAFRFESGRPLDAFEKLFAAHNLQEFLHCDDGEMIFRIMKTREALQLYGEHLRLLATRVA